MQNIKIIYKNIGDIIPYENNTKEHDKTQIDNIAKSIEEFGFTQPILIDKDNVIIAGHGRVLGAMQLGIEQIPCVVGDWLTDEEVKKYRILDNKLNESNWIDDVLALEIEDIDFSEYDLDFELEEYNVDDYGTDFELADGDKSEICQMTFTLHNKQAELIKYAMGLVKDDINETFGNTNSNGNAIYEVVRQWAEQRK